MVEPWVILLAYSVTNPFYLGVSHRVGRAAARRGIGSIWPC